MINVDGIRQALKPECVTCNLYVKIGQGKKCSSCLFIKNSAPEKGKPSRIGLSMKLRKFGLTKKQCQNWGKYHLFQYLYHPELWFKPPVKPTHDKYGNVVESYHYYNLHHKNGVFCDDREENHEWLLPTEHPHSEQKHNAEKREVKKKAVRDHSSLGLMRI